MRVSSLAAVALVALSFTTGCKKKNVEQQVAVEKVHVEPVDVTEGMMPRTIAVTGTLRGQRQTDLAANAAGRVLETFVERGTEVKKGDLLAQARHARRRRSPRPRRAPTVELARGPGRERRSASASATSSLLAQDAITPGRVRPHRRRSARRAALVDGRRGPRQRRRAQRSATAPSARPSAASSTER